MTRTVEGKRLREEGNSNRTVSRVRSGKSNADRSSIVTERSDALNYLMKIVVMGWLLESFKVGEREKERKRDREKEREKERER